MVGKKLAVAIAVAGVSAAILIFAVAKLGFSKPEKKSQEKVEFIIGNGAEPETLSPHLLSGTPAARIGENLFEGLTINDPETGLGIPGIAKSWDINERGDVYTFHLRKSSWSDGTPVTAQTFRDSWIRVLNPETASPYADFPALFLKGAKAFKEGKAGPEAVGVRVVDEQTLEVSLVGPMPYVTDALAHHAFSPVPIHAIDKYGKTWTEPGKMVSNGAFVLQEWIPQDRIVASANPKYWDAESVRLDQVTFLPVEDDLTTLRLYESGEVDLIPAGIPPDRLDSLKGRSDFHLSPRLASYYYDLNVKVPPLTDVRVRKALNMSIDREALVEKVKRGGEFPSGAISPTFSNYTPPKGLPYDPEAAKRFLAEAGFPEGKGFPRLTILYNTNEAHKKIAEFIQSQWLENLGIKVELSNQEWKTFLITRREGDYAIARDGWLGDYSDPNTFLDMFVTGNPQNSPQWSNKRYDGLIHKASQMPGGPERMGVLFDAEKILVEEDLPIIPLYIYSNLALIDTSKWGGWFLNTPDRHNLKFIYKK